MLNVLAEFPLHLLVMAVLLGASGFFSGAETALFNLSRDQLRRFRASRSPFRRITARLMDDPRRVLVTVLFGNMTVNVAFFVMGVMLMHKVGEGSPEAVGTWRFIIGTLTPLLVIVFGEVTPKSVAATMPGRLAPVAALPLMALGYLVFPVRLVLGYAIVVPLARLITGGRRDERGFVTTDELQAIVEVAENEGAVSSAEGDMLADILELGEMTVREVTTPRVEIVGCDVRTPTRDVLPVFKQSMKTKILVYEGRMDNVVGVVYAKTAFLNPEVPLADLVRPVHYVPETKTVESLLKTFRARRIQFAVVVDEYGGLAGGPGDAGRLSGGDRRRDRRRDRRSRRRTCPAARTVAVPVGREPLDPQLGGPVRHGSSGGRRPVHDGGRVRDESAGTAAPARRHGPLEESRVLCGRGPPPARDAGPPASAARRRPGGGVCLIRRRR